MTERLSQLMREESDALDVPPAPTAAIMNRGRSLRRHRRFTSLAVAAAVVGVVAGGGFLATHSPGADDDPTAPVAAPAAGGAFAYGSTLYLTDHLDRPVDIGEPVKSLYYTSAGVVVRHGANQASDGGGPQRFSLVTDDGTVTRLSVTTEEAVASTDVDQPYLAYGVKTGDGFAVEIRDVGTDTVVKRLPITGRVDGGWSVPPVSLDGDTVYVATGEDRFVAIDWRTGERSPAPHLSGYMPEVLGGATASGDESGASVIEAATGKVLATADLAKNAYGWFRLSPDGRYAALTIEEMEAGSQPPGPAIYDVGTGSHIAFGHPGWRLGWTPDGHLLAVAGKQVYTCDPGSGGCTETGTWPGEEKQEPPAQTCSTTGTTVECSLAPQEEPDLRLGGVVYES